MPIESLEMGRFPGCCGVAVVHSIWPQRSQFKRAIKMTQQYDVEANARGLIPKYGLLLYTNTVENGKKYLEEAKKVGFKELTRFKNPKTDNTVVVMGLDLNKPANPNE